MQVRYTWYAEVCVDPAGASEASRAIRPHRCMSTPPSRCPDGRRATSGRINRPLYYPSLPYLPPTLTLRSMVPEPLYRNSSVQNTKSAADGRWMWWYSAIAGPDEN